MTISTAVGEVKVGQAYIVREDEKRFNRKRILHVKDIYPTGTRPTAVCDSSIVGMPTKKVRISLDRLICPSLYRREPVLDEVAPSEAPECDNCDGAPDGGHTNEPPCKYADDRGALPEEAPLR